MFWLDTTILVVLGGAALLGLRSGLVKQIARVVGFVAALFGSIFFHGAAADWLQQNVMKGTDPQATGTTAYVGVFLGIYLAFFFTAMLIERFLKAVKLNWVNRLAGGVTGAGKAALIMGALFMAVISFPNPVTDDVIKQSRGAPVLAAGAGLALKLVPKQYTDDLQNGLNKLQQEAEQQGKDVEAKEAKAATTP
jgi:membrane protein required for colicin V production